jgi:hypothetical protein
MVKTETIRPGLRGLAATLPAIVFLAVYLPKVGHGFLLDDYRWVLEGRLTSPADWLHPFLTNVGFYRPVVSLSFGINHALFGLEPFYYGLTNVVFALTTSALIYRLAGVLGLPRGAAVAASALWLLSFHGTSGAVLWISGRTALILTAAATAAAIAIVRGQLTVAALATALALLSKEEAVALPLILGAWLYLLAPGRIERRHIPLLQWLAISAVVLAAYFVARTFSGAMTLETAPAFYRLTLDPLALAKNAREYLDRTFTLPAIVVLAAWACLRPESGRSRGRMNRPLLVASLVWVVGGYSVTALVPVRSSLYVCLPSVGACLMAAEICRVLWTAAADRSRHRALVGAILLTLISAPIHHERTHHLVRESELSHAVWTALPVLAPEAPSGSTVVIHDDAAAEDNVRTVIGGFLPDAYELHTGRRVAFWLEPSAPDDGPPPCETCVAARLVLRQGRLSTWPPAP